MNIPERSGTDPGNWHSSASIEGYATPGRANSQNIDGQVAEHVLNLEPRDLMRRKETEYKEQGLADESLDNDALVAAMVATPKLIERPIVIKNGKAAIGRPPEKILDIL